MRAILKANARWVGCTAVAIAGLISKPGYAQPALAKLRPPTATLDEAFTQVAGLRELADGRVIVTDAPEVRVVVADFATRRVEPIGRQGRGPGEFVRPGGLYAFGDDRTLLADNGAVRWLILSGTRIVETVPPDDPAVTATFAGTRYADSHGTVAGWAVDKPVPGIQDAGVHDSGTVVFVDRRTGRIDTVAKVVRTPQRFFAWTDPSTGETSFRAAAAAFATSEDFLLFNDGWLAVVRLNPYRVDWRDPRGSWTHGAPLPVPAIRVTDREKAFYVERFARAANAPFVVSPSVPADLRAAILGAARRRWTEFPDFVPPIQGMSSLPAPEGRVVIPRTPTAAWPDPTYDVVDRDGKLVARLQLARGERIVGFGKTSVYVAARDADDLEQLRRHPWP